MKNHIQIAVLLVCLFTGPVYAQNNPVFYGGIGAGASGNGYRPVTSDTALFHGGIDDGIAYAATITGASGNVFHGGSGSGHHFHASAPVYIDKIFLGGIGDGWADSYLPVTPLPLVLLSFSGMQLNGAHLLQWHTVQEINTDHFELERSATGAVFSVLGEIKALDSDRGESEYQFTDDRPLKGNNFYRLKMIDTDRKSTYSNIVLLHSKADKNTISFYPNPAATQLNVLFSKATAGTVQADIYNVVGKKVDVVVNRQNDCLFQVDLRGLAPGIYSLRIQEGLQLHVFKFVKEG